VVSPDGSRIVTAGLGADGRAHLWVRRLDSRGSELLPGSEDAYYPFWSPDSKSIAFFAQGKLRRIDLARGLPEVLSDVPNDIDAQGGTWNRNGLIVFGIWGGPLYRVPAPGGGAKPVTVLDRSRREVEHVFPQFLPDGSHFLYSVVSPEPGVAGVYIGSLDSTEKKRILAGGTPAEYSSAGYLVYARGSTLMAQAFDPKRLELQGDSVPVVEQLTTVPWLAFAAFSVSENGVLAYRTGSVDTELTWFDRNGKREGTVGPRAEYSNPSLSRDGSRLVVERFDPQVNTRDLWLFDLGRGTSSRFTSDPADDMSAAWTYDGRQVFFSSDRKGPRDIYVKPASGIGPETVAFESKQEKSLEDLSPDGRYLLYNDGTRVVSSPESVRMWVLPLFGDRKPYLFIQGSFYNARARFSPNGGFVAYSSGETGSLEVYVQTFPEQLGKWQISTDGGSQPMWRGDGKELFYLSGSKLMAVNVKAEGKSLTAGVPKALFEVPGLAQVGGKNCYVVTPDGQRFLFTTLPEQAETARINVIINWPALLKKQ
jgi:Tol biopolymer transport system component